MNLAAHLAAAGGIRLLADDLTGALDSAAAFGAGVPVGLDRPPTLVPGSGSTPPVQVVATATRDVPPDRLPQDLTPLAAWLAGGGLAFKKVDSLLRGNTFLEAAWLARAGGFTRRVFAPALPAQGRYTVGGRACLLRAAEACDPARVEPGPDLQARLQAADAVLHPGLSPLCWEVPEVRTQDELVALMRARLRDEARGRTLWCGSAGLATALASLVPATRPTEQEGMAGRATTPARVWLLGASHHAVTRRQWQVARACCPEALTLHEGEPAAFDALLGPLSAAPGLALLDLSLHRPVSPTEAADTLQRQVAALVRLPPPDALLVLGGDTLRALVLASGAGALRTGRPLRPGWGRAVCSGGTWDGLAVDARSGAFGTDEDLCLALRAHGVPMP